MLRVLRALDAHAPQDAGRPSSPDLRVPAGRGRPRRALRRVLLESDRHGARCRASPIRRRRRRSCAPSTMRETRSRHRRAPDPRDRPRGRAARGARDGGVGHRPPRRRKCVGIGIDYREIDRPPELFREAYALARQAGLKTHGPCRRVRHALDQRAHRDRRSCGVDRIDHGYTVRRRSGRSPRRCAEAGIVFTVVPTNSYYLRTLPPERWALDHPIRRMPRAGPAHPSEHRRPDVAQRHADARLADDGRDFGFGARRPAPVHAQRPRRGLDRRRHAAALEERVGGAIRFVEERTHEPVRRLLRYCSVSRWQSGRSPGRPQNPSP